MNIEFQTSDGEHFEKALFITPNEEQDQEIIEENSKLIFTPKFIPYYPKLQDYGFDNTEILIFGFIDFYSTGSSKFYFTNKQLAEMFNIGETKVSLSITKLEQNGIIKTNFKIKAGGGKIRFIQNSDFGKNSLSTFKNQKSDLGNLKGNNNKINNNKKKEIISNKLDITKSDDFESKKNIDIESLIFELKKICSENGIAYDKTKDRMFGKHIMTGKDYGDFCENIGQNRIEFAKNVLKASLKINFRKGICSGPKMIYQNYSDVYNQTKLKGKQKQKVAFIPSIYKNEGSQSL